MRRLIFQMKGNGYFHGFHDGANHIFIDENSGLIITEEMVRYIDTNLYLFSSNLPNSLCVKYSL